MSISSWRIFLTILSFSEIASKNNCQAYDFKRIAASRNLLESLCSASEANEDSNEEQEESTTKKMKFMDEATRKRVVNDVSFYIFHSVI